MSYEEIRIRFLEEAFAQLLQASGGFRHLETNNYLERMPELYSIYLAGRRIGETAPMPLLVTEAMNGPFGIPIRCDPSMHEGTLEIRDGEKIIGRLVNVKP